MTESEGCRIIASLLYQGGVRKCISSPGTRNAPIISAFINHGGLSTIPVIDERSAAFYALGISRVTSKPVALVCTSGSAVMNYGPALSEALFSNIPLIAVTADRPREAIGRNCQQTMQQYGALSATTKATFSIDCRDSMSHIAATVSDAVNTALRVPRGPVHLNVAIYDPTTNAETDATSLRDISLICETSPLAVPSQKEMRDIASTISNIKKVLIISGGMSPDSRLNRALSKLSSFGNYAILAEWNSNLHGSHIITNTDVTVTCAEGLHDTDLTPDIVITCGNALLSLHVSAYIKGNGDIQHWHVGMEETAPDSFGCLSRHIRALPQEFFPALAAATRRTESPRSDFSDKWQYLSKTASETIEAVLDKETFSDISAINEILRRIPPHCNLQLSNGMTSRYVNLFNEDRLIKTRLHRCDCNRGISGIDGCTSTAMGSASCYTGSTVFISGDTSALYDIGAFNLSNIPPEFKMVVINNQGGVIFKHISATNRFNAIDDYLSLPTGFSFESISTSRGFRYYNASNISQLKSVLDEFYNDNTSPALLEIVTSQEDSIKTYREIFKQLKNLD